MTNNNESMATVVETFLVEETINLIHDNEALDKWKQKVEELQLHGQKTVVKEDKSPIPFLWMNSGLVQTFSTLCPTKVDIDKYDKTPIPVELLEMVSLCQKEKYFDKIRVWYNEQDKDPVIVGYVAGDDDNYKNQDWFMESPQYSKQYLIGRWADVKASLDQLIERAKAIFTKTATLNLKKQIRDNQRQLEDLETTVEQMFGGSIPLTPNLPF